MSMRLTQAQRDERILRGIEAERSSMRAWLGIDEHGQDLPSVGTPEFEAARERAVQRSIR